MVTTPATQNELLQNRNRMVAKSFYRQLKTEGFTHEQIIELSATLLDLVNTELHGVIVRPGRVPLAAEAPRAK